MRKVTIKFFANKFNILADQLEFTLAIHRYLLYLGSLVKGDFMCVNQEHHEKVKVFDTEPLMREHWKECHGIQVEEILMPMLVPDMLKEPGRNNLNVQGSSGTQSSTPGPSGPQGGAPGPGGVTPARPGTDPGQSRRTNKLAKQEVKRIAKEERRLRLQREGKPAEAPEAPSDTKSDSNSSVIPMESETQVEPAKEVILFTGGKPDEYEPDVGVLELEKELKEYEKK